MPARAQKGGNAKKSTVTSACVACLNNFSPTELVFTIDPDKCPKRLASCNKSTSTAKCEPIIDDCIAANCASEGACSDEKGVRALFYGCLKAEGPFLPYICQSLISGKASTQASIGRSQAAARTAAQQAEIKRQEAEVEAQRTAASRAAEEAKVRIEQEKNAAAVRQKEIEAEASLAASRQAAELAQQAQDAAAARAKKEKDDARNSKPSVKYNNIIAEAKKAIANARTYVTKAYSLLGIQKTTEPEPKKNAMFFPPQFVKTDPISVGTDPKSKSLSSGSKYKDAATFKCTKNTKESFVRNELANAYNVLMQAKDKLSSEISELEMINSDDEAAGRIDDNKITTLYQVMNKLTETTNVLEEYVGMLVTSCETRCEGMASMMGGSTGGKIEFDDDGNIIESESSSKSYSCKDLETSSSSSGFDMMAMMSGKATAMTDMMGGIGNKVAEITGRSTQAVVKADRSLDMTEIAVNTGKFEEGNDMNYAQVNACLQYAINDVSTYSACVQSAISSQLAILANNPENTTMKTELAKSVVTVLDLLNGDSYREYSLCSSFTGYGEGETAEDCNYNALQKEVQQGTYSQYNTCVNMSRNYCCIMEFPADEGNILQNLNDLNAMRQCSMSLASRLNRVKENMDKQKKDNERGQGQGGYGSGNIIINNISDDGNFISFNIGNTLFRSNAQAFLDTYCNGAKKGSFTTLNSSTILYIKKGELSDALSPNQPLPGICTQSRR
jgi:hypothetical protein